MIYPQKFKLCCILIRFYRIYFIFSYQIMIYPKYLLVIFLEINLLFLWIHVDHYFLIVTILNHRFLNYKNYHDLLITKKQNFNYLYQDQWIFWFFQVLRLLFQKILKFLYLSLLKHLYLFLKPHLKAPTKILASLKSYDHWLKLHQKDNLLQKCQLN